MRENANKKYPQLILSLASDIFLNRYNFLYCHPNLLILYLFKILKADFSTKIKKFAPHKKILHGSSAHEFSARVYRTEFSAHLHFRMDLSHIFWALGVWLRLPVFGYRPSVTGQRLPIDFSSSQKGFHKK